MCYAAGVAERDEARFLTPRWRRLALLGALVAFLFVLAAQVWSAIETRQTVQDAIESSAGPAGRQIAREDIEREQLRQEMIAKRIENQTKALIWTNLAAALAATLGLILSILGAAGTAFAYVETRDKERRDRADAQAREREDRLAASLNETLTRLVSAEARERAVGAAGLIYFFAPDRADFHLQALSALIAAARNKTEDEGVWQSLRLAVEHAVRAIDNAQLRGLSWQKVRLDKADLSGCDLSGLDLRDADLRDAVLQRALLTGANLTAAQLQGADLSHAALGGANLANADLAGASLAHADLPDTRIDGLKILNLDVEQAKFGEKVAGWRELPWEATLNWRLAIFPESIRGELKSKYGDAPPEQHVLMLVWEMPPRYVAGGTWTACYHLVRKLRQRGARVTVVAPWRREDIADMPFGIEVPIVGLGIVPVADETPEGQAARPRHGGAAGPYGDGRPAQPSPYAADYGGAPAGWSPYQWLQAAAPGWPPYGSLAGPYGGGLPGRSSPDAADYGGAPAGWSPYQWLQAAAPAWSPYGSLAGPYGGGLPGQASSDAADYGDAPAGWSPYQWLQAAAPAWSPYGSLAGPYGGGRPGQASPDAGGYGGYRSGPGAGGSLLYRLMGEFRRRLLRYVEGKDFDLIHAHDWVTFEAARAAARARNGGAKTHRVPWIAHFHSTETERQVGRENPLAADIERQAAADADRIVAPGNVTRAVLMVHYGVPEERIAVIPNLLSEGAPPPFDMGRFETKRVLYVGRLSLQKGVDLFVAAVEKARQAVPLEAEIVGSGEADPALARDWLRWRGAVPWDARGSAFRGASVVVVPSRFEPFGMVVLEAMQHRVPIIYPGYSGAADALSSGVKVDPHDSEAVAGHIARLLGDFAAWEKTVRRQAEEIEDFQNRRYETRMIDVWEEALAAAETGRPAAAAASGAEPAQGG